MNIQNKIIENEIQDLLNKTKDLPQIKLTDILWLWSLNYYDGILSAIGMYQGNPVYVECISSDDLDAFREIEGNDSSRLLWHPRVFIVKQMNPDDFILNQHKHLLWCKYAGYHNNMIVDQFRKDPRLRMGTFPNEYKDGYERYKRETEGMVSTHKMTNIGYCVGGDENIGYITDY